jgi:hypothetical protein
MRMTMVFAATHEHQYEHRGCERVGFWEGVEKVTEMGEHAPEDGKRGRGLLVELAKGCAGQLLEVLCELERGRGGGCHGGRADQSAG